MKTQPRRPRWRMLAAVTAVGLLAITGCSKDSSDGDAGSGGSAGTIRISSQDFGEQKTLAQVYGQYLEAQGFDVDIQDPIGSRTQIYAAFAKGDLDLELDYAGSAVSELKGGKPTSDEAKTYEMLTAALAKKDLVAGKAAPAADSNALVALSSWAKKNDVTKISDLSKVSGTLTLGGAAECAKRADCLVGYNGAPYNLDLKFKLVEYGPPLVAGLKANEIQLAQYQTTAPEIASGEIVVLEDDKGLFSAENVVPVVRKSVADKDSKLLPALDKLSAQITTDDLVAWNEATDTKKKDPADVAEAWLSEKGLVD